MLQSFFLTSVAVFVALDVVGAIPVYVGMTSGMEFKERNRALDTSMLVAFFVAVGFGIAGLKLFSVLGITLSDFKMAGGIVLLLLSLADVVSKPEVGTRASGSTGIVPLAVPLITGPVVLTSLILQVKQVGYPMALAALFVNYAFAWIVLRKSNFISQMIGRDGTVIFSKLSSLLMAAIAVAMIRAGVFEAIQAFRP